MSFLNQASYETIPTVKIYPVGVCYYSSHIRRSRARHRGYDACPDDGEDGESGSNIKEVRKSAYSGRVTVGMRRRVSRCIDLLLSSAVLKHVVEPSTGKGFSFRINFVTLTLSDPSTKLSDRDIKKLLLDPFLKRMRYRHKLNSYVWKAERQKNGALHFHIVTDTWLPWKSIQDNWNDLQRKHGLLESYHDQFERWDPNSTDVHAVRSGKEARVYIAKYLGKSGSKDDIVQGRLWDASLNLKRAKYPTALVDNKTSEYLSHYTEEHPDLVIVADYFSFVIMNDRAKKGNLPANLLAEYRQLIYRVRSGEW